MKVVICAILRTENRYLEEWLDYHLSLGFDHIYLCDNAEEDEEKALEIVDGNVKYIDKVTVFPYYGKKGQQIKAYTECYNERNLDFDWMAFIDLDEFITISEGSKYKDIHEYLSNIKADVVLLNWMIYGDNNLINDDGGKVLYRFKKPMPFNISAHNVFGAHPINSHVKQMLRKGLLLSNVGVHVSPLLDTYKVVNADGQVIENSAIQKNYTFDNCFIRHYITKTIEEYVKTKIARGRKGDGASGQYTLDEFFLYNKMTLKNITQYLKLCKALGFKCNSSYKWWIKNILRSYFFMPLFMKGETQKVI